MNDRSRAWRRAAALWLACSAALGACGGEASLTVVITRRPTPEATSTPVPPTATFIAPTATPVRPTNTRTVTRTPTPTATATATTAARTATRTETERATRTEEPTATRTATSAAATPSSTSSPTAPIPTVTLTPVASATASATESIVATPTSTQAVTVTATQTGATPSATSTSNPTATPTPTATSTGASTPTPSPTVAAASTSTPTSTPTPTATPVEGGAVCGNGFLEPGENFFDTQRNFLVGDPDGASCPQDAAVRACTPGTTPIAFDVLFDRPPGTSPNTVTALIGYRSDRFALPGTGTATSVRQRITFPPPAPFVFTPNDFDYALRVVVGRSSAIAEGRLLTVSFDPCQGAPAPTIDDLACSIEGCSGSGGAVAGCSCSVGIR